MDHKSTSSYKKEAYGLLIAFLGIFFILSLISYHPEDGGLFIGNMSGSVEIKNWFGHLGAFFSAPVFVFTFGYLSILIFLYVLWGGINFIIDKPFPKAKKWLVSAILWAFWGSVIIAFIYKKDGDMSFYPSGMIGKIYIDSIFTLMGEFGAIFASVVLLIASAIISTRISFFNKLRKAKKSLASSLEEIPDHIPSVDEIEDKISNMFSGLAEEDGDLSEDDEKEHKKPEKIKSEPNKTSPKQENDDDSEIDILKNEINHIRKDGKIDHTQSLQAVSDKQWDGFVKSVLKENEEKVTPPDSHEKDDLSFPVKIDEKKEISVKQKKVAPPQDKIEVEVNLENLKKQQKSDFEDTDKEELEVEEAVKSKEVNIDKVKKRAGKGYKFPSIKLLAEQGQEEEVSKEELEANAAILVAKLADFNVEAKVVKAYAGPVVTMFELKLAPGVKISKITGLTQDLAMGLQARGIRIIAPIPGKPTVGVEIPNRKPQMVTLRSLINSKAFTSASSPLTLALGKTVNGDVYVADLAKMPHILIAGTTGSGKSVGINTIINSILYRAKPDDVKFVLVDPKMLELSPYKDLEQHHLAFSPDLDEKVITKPDNAIAILNSVVQEMERRYLILSKSGVRNLEDYNRKLKNVGAEKMPHPELNHRNLPYIVVIIDELADLMMTASKEIEQPIARLAQMARAIGIHLVVATQRPSVDVLTGVIKANFPTRLAYQVSQKNDSRTILDMNGAEQLLGLGDMLFLPSGQSKPIRLQNGFISTEEVEAVIAHIVSQPEAEPLWLHVDLKQAKTSGVGGFNDELDTYFDEAKKIVVMHQQGSVSLLQRRLKVGYARAARIMDQLEEAGVVGPFEGSKAREVRLTEEDL